MKLDEDTLGEKFQLNCEGLKVLLDQWLVPQQ